MRSFPPLAKRGEVGIGGVENLMSEGQVLVILIEVELLDCVSVREAG
jgi:hypothetical protein